MQMVFSLSDRSDDNDSILHTLRDPEACGLETSPTRTISLTLRSFNPHTNPDPNLTFMYRDFIYHHIAPLIPNPSINLIL